MPELAEVEYYRRQWNSGIGAKITRVELHPQIRIFRGSKLEWIEKLEGKVLVSSEARAKQMMFRFSGNLWLGLHLGMTGRMSEGEPRFKPDKHDHLVLYQKERALIFNDTRQFGRVLIAESPDAPEWWTTIAPAIGSKEFTTRSVAAFLKRHGRLPIKSALLLQKGFPGIGNWMADEILWRAGIAPVKLAASLKPEQVKRIWRDSRFVAREALGKISENYGDPPKGWLFHERWKRSGVCPRHKTVLRRDNIGGRTTAWCPKCQK